MKSINGLLLSREEINKKLHMTNRTSYSLFPPTSLKGKLRNDKVVRTLNSARANGQCAVDYIPDDLMNIKECSLFLGVTIRTLFNRLNKKNGIPHFRLSKKFAVISKKELLKFI